MTRTLAAVVLVALIGRAAAADKFTLKVEEGTDAPSQIYRAQLNSNGSPSEAVAAGYQWKPGTELAEETADIRKLQKKVA